MSSQTIGEVLNELKDEFDDITISKIRFLESEGLISPDRTPSGYRKFTQADVDRLRYVLRAQRDRYLPLKVIKDELDRLDAGPGLAAAPPDANAATPVPPGQGTTEAAATVASPGGEPGAPPALSEPAGDERFSAAELVEASGLDADALRDLVYHGLLAEEPYDAEDLRIATVAARLLDSGLEVRHLRMYRQFADREASFAEAFVAPLLGQHSEQSLRTATERVQALAAAGGELHRALLHKQLRTLLRG